MARPQLEIDETQVEALAKLGAPLKEIASFFGCSTSTLRRRFAANLSKGRAGLKMSLRRAQIQAAIEDRNPTMLIWLGKQLLGQSDKKEPSGESLTYKQLLAQKAAVDAATRPDQTTEPKNEPA